MLSDLKKILLRQLIMWVLQGVVFYKNHPIFLSKPCRCLLGLLFFISVDSIAAPFSWPSKAILSHSSPNPSYHRLEKMLPWYQKAVRDPWPRLESDHLLVLGMQDPAVQVLRQRLCTTQDLAREACLAHSKLSFFDRQLKEAVESFQQRHGLLVDGVVGDRTREALNVSPEQRYHQIQLNLQRLSHWIALAEPAYIWVNVPDHRLRLVKDHQIIFMSRVIVGKPSRQTPEINSKVTRIVLNPYWIVPPGIARHDVIPQIIQNKDYLRRNRIRVFAAHQSNKALDPNEVDWLAVKRYPSRYILRQDPGPHNALGQIKFVFSNPHLVYLHDTPSKRLFEAERRLFSSGCVRIEAAFQFFKALEELDPSLKQAVQQSEAILESGRTTYIDLKQPIPIHLTYITAWVDKQGVLHFWDDVYGRDPVLPRGKKALASDLPLPV